MKKRTRENEVNYWPGVADCMLGLFMIALILGITNKVIELIPETPGDTVMITRKQFSQYESLKSELEKEKIARQNAENKLAKLETELNIVKSELQKTQELLLKITNERDDLLKENLKADALIADLNKQIEKLKTEIENLKSENDKLQGENGKPPILVVDATEVSFEKGKADLQRIHRETLQKDVFTKLLTIVEKYKSVDTIEIIGHTDWSPVGGNSNLDHTLLKALEGNEINALNAGSNADLGLMRAVAVKQEWDQWMSDRLPRKIQVRCYSAAQGIDPPSVNGKIYANQARRIEIRFTQLKKNSKN
jgi:flagellar motor protein MotB